MKFLRLFLAISLVFVAPIVPLRADAPRPATLFQTSTIQALGLGLYDGDMPFADVLKHGTLGLGTLQSLDGEVMILDGRVFQLRGDGKMFEVPGNARTPFAMVTPFRADKTLPLRDIGDLAQLEKTLDGALPTFNVPFAFRIDGKFSALTTRSVPAQQRPFPSLAEAVRQQNEFALSEVTGTLIGFRMPSYLAQVNVTGYHFHFLTSDRTQGGHVLKVQVQDAVAQIQILRNFTLNLPALPEFDAADFSQDQSAALHQAESARD